MQAGGAKVAAPPRSNNVFRSPAFHRSVKVSVTLVVVCLLWEAGCRWFEVPSYLLPAPSRVFASLFGSSVDFVHHGSVTLYETLLGFVAAVALGALAAAIIVVFPKLADIIMPLLLIAQIVPKVAIAPILLIWLGYGLAPKIFVAFLVAFFPIVINTASGLAAVERELLDLARSLEATRWQIFWKFRVPSALPLLFDGMKISVTLAVIGAVIAEFVGGNEGLGVLIIIANQELDTALAFASLFLMSAGGLVLYALIEASERVLIPWNSAASGQILGDHR
nr:ABC transporter permease [Mesorhizobium camelthorni]